MENELFYTYSEAAIHLRRYIAEYLRLNGEWRTSNYGKYIAARMREVDAAIKFHTSDDPNRKMKISGFEGCFRSSFNRRSGTL